MSTTATVEQDVLQKPKFKNQYENYIGGKWVAPSKGEYFENISPVDGKSFTKIPRSTSEDIEKAIDAAWGSRTIMEFIFGDREKQYAFKDCR